MTTAGERDLYGWGKTLTQEQRDWLDAMRLKLDPEVLESVRQEVWSSSLWNTAHSTPDVVCIEGKGQFPFVRWHVTLNGERKGSGVSLTWRGAVRRATRAVGDVRAG